MSLHSRYLWETNTCDGCGSEAAVYGYVTPLCLACEASYQGDECCDQPPGMSALSCAHACVELVCDLCGASLGERHFTECGKPNTQLKESW